MIVRIWLLGYRGGVGEVFFCRAGFLFCIIFIRSFLTLWVEERFYRMCKFLFLRNYLRVNVFCYVFLFVYLEIFKNCVVYYNMLIVYI